MKSRLRPASLFAVAAILLASLPAAAQSDSGYQDDGIRQSVARISYFEGAVSFNRGDDPDGWQLASVNYPVTLGDRIWTGWPLTRTRPVSIGSTPKMARQSSVRPAPISPASPTISQARNVRLMESSTPLRFRFSTRSSS